MEAPQCIYMWSALWGFRFEIYAGDPRLQEPPGHCLPLPWSLEGAEVDVSMSASNLQRFWPVYQRTHSYMYASDKIGWIRLHSYSARFRYISAYLTKHSQKDIWWKRIVWVFERFKCAPRVTFVTCHPPTVGALLWVVRQQGIFCGTDGVSQRYM